MKNNQLHTITLSISLMLALGIMLTGCGNSVGTTGETSSTSGESLTSSAVSEAPMSTESSGNQSASESAASGDGGSTALTDLVVRFGDDGQPFALHIFDNSTAATIAEYVGTASFRLPINHYDDYENWEVMQYYDLPSSYVIPSNPETITSAKAGELYYSNPNRIVLFYQDAEVSGEYTKVGYFDYSEEFQAAVENNPVLEGWGNKIVNISGGE